MDPTCFKREQINSRTFHSCLCWLSITWIMFIIVFMICLLVNIPDADYANDVVTTYCTNQDDDQVLIDLSVLFDQEDVILGQTEPLFEIGKKYICYYNICRDKNISKYISNDGDVTNCHTASRNYPILTTYEYRKSNIIAMMVFIILFFGIFFLSCSCVMCFCLDLIGIVSDRMV